MKTYTSKNLGRKVTIPENDDELSDELNPQYIFATIHTELLVQALNGEIDLDKLARQEMANRGLGKDGKQVGFDAAAKIHGVKR